MNNFLVVGGSTGIGNSLVLKLSQNNKVWATYNNTSPSIQSNNISWHSYNVLDEDTKLEFLPQSLQGLAYCVGAINLKPVTRYIQQDFIKDYQLQVWGAVKTIQQCMPALKNTQQASIVLFSTVAVQTGFNFHSMVAASKGAIEGLTRALAAELAPKIRVNAIAPSITQTPLAANFLNTPEKVESNIQRHPLKAIAKPQDIANIAEFLLLPESSAFITGQIISVDGGLSSLR